MKYTIEDCLPMNLSLALLYKPPLIVRFIVPIIKYILKDKLSERLYVINDNIEFEEFHDIPSKYIPIGLGGTHEVYTHDTIMNCYITNE